MAFTKTTKKGIDIALPSILSGLAAYYFVTKKDDRDIKFILLVIILVWLFSYAVTSQLTKLIFEAAAKQDIDVPVDSVKIVKDADGSTKTVSTVSTTDISGITRRLRNDIYDTPWTGHSNSLWWEVSLLSDTDLSSVYNQWNKEYFSEESESLVAAIKDEYFDAYGAIDNTAYHYKENVLAKLARLGAK